MTSGGSEHQENPSLSLNIDRHINDMVFIVCGNRPLESLDSMYDHRS